MTVQNTLTASTLILGLFVAFSKAKVYTLNLHSNMTLTYELKVQSGETVCEFGIVANTTGWVAIGLSESGGMHGSDIFMGGVIDDTNEIYGGDYHVHANATQRLPALDARQDWHLASGRQVDGITRLTVVRFLDTGDAENDTVIENRNMNLIWSYNDNDNLSQRHRERGVVVVNLVAGADSDVPTPSPPPTPAPSTSTTPLCQIIQQVQETTPSSAAGLQLSAGIFALGAWANIQKYIFYT